MNLHHNTHAEAQLKPASARTRATRAAILDAAAQLAAERGITSTTMDDIAKLAGVAKGSLYYNFKSKDAIFSDILTTSLSALGDQISVARQSETVPRKQMVAMIIRMITAIDDKPELARVMLAEIFRVDRPWRDSMDITKKILFEQFANVYANTGLGNSNDPGSTQLLGATIVGAALVAGIDHHLYHPDVPLQQVADTLVSLWISPEYL